MSHSCGLFQKKQNEQKEDIDKYDYQYEYEHRLFNLINLVSAKIITPTQAQNLTYDQKEVLNHWGVFNLLSGYAKLLLLEDALTISIAQAKRFDCIPILNSVNGGEMTIQQVLDLTNESAKSYFGKTLDEMEAEERVNSDQPQPFRNMS